jgi:hypothetical protein
MILETPDKKSAERRAAHAFPDQTKIPANLTASLEATSFIDTSVKSALDDLGKKHRFNIEEDIRTERMIGGFGSR